MPVQKQDAVESPSVEPGGEAAPGEPGRKPPSAETVEDWLVAYLSKLLDIGEEKMATTTSFSRYGLDSSASISMVSDLSDWLGREIDPGLIYSYPTIEALAAILASEQSRATSDEVRIPRDGPETEMPRPPGLGERRQDG